MEGHNLALRKTFSSLLNFLEMIKFEHTIFALPFAYIGMVMAEGGFPEIKKFLLITLAFLAARTYAMTLNRIVDLPYDTENPRTRKRPLVTGKVTKKTAYFALFFSLALLFGAAYGLGTFVLKLLPFALFFLTFYHFTKRFTYLSHFILGFTDGLAPLGAWIAIRNSAFSSSDLPGWLLLFIVTFWIAGFDIIYQCQDVEYDRKANLHSIPARFGLKTALSLARICHATMFLGLLVLLKFLDFWLPYVISLAITLFLLIKEHMIISPYNLTRLNEAFFNINGYISIIIFSGLTISILL
ncbi:MAG: putative 4-hydroxybenzoate polyprenyltransferase [Desulfobacterota bacterium]|nr:putative 4-hydroxybenzoate polyprenyltransferase [Thermodesulfobacteriota bacterium]MDW8002325.1 UbiA-like polyprenyltransferase [Deltaproteobacteria bacterium]